MKMEKQVLLLFAFCSTLLGEGSGENGAIREAVGVGLIVDMGSREGNIIRSCVSKAISGFNSSYQMRISALHTKLSKGDPSLALSAAFDLWENDKVGVILVAQNSKLEARYLAEFGDHPKVPLISISPLESAEAKAVAAFIELYEWEDVVLIHEDNGNWSDFFEETTFEVAYKTAVSASSEDDDIIGELHRLRAMRRSLFVVHVSHVLASRLFEQAKRLGMIGRGYAWIVTSKTMNQLKINLNDSSVFESMQGFIGFRSYKTTESKELCNKEFDMQGMMKNFDYYIHGKVSSSTTFEIVNLMGERERRVGFWTSSGEITIGLHGSTHRRHLFSSSTPGNLETIIWPGGTSAIPKGRMMRMSSNILNIGVPVTNGFSQLLKVDRDLQTNATIVSGFCIDVFRAAMDGLKYQMPYQFVPFEYNNPNIGETYDDLVYQVYLQKYDAVVGDITITANRSLYVDFTLPYTDMGVGMVVQKTPKDSRNLWIFLKPLTGGLWLTIVGVYVLTASVIWLIERPSFVEQTPQSNGQMERMFRFSFSILLFFHWEKLSSNLSRSVVLLWVFVVFILGSNYTATLTSMMTVQHIELNSKMSSIGHRTGPVTQEVIGNLNFESSSSTSVWLTSPEEFAKALSEGSKNGGVSAIIDEMPYIKIFLEKYPSRYSMIGPVMPNTNGFGFAFPKGSAMASDISREIEKLRQDGRLQMLENAWFKSPTTSFDSGDASSSVNPLTVGDFRGLFLISGTFTALASLLFFASLLYKNIHILKKWGRSEIVKQYICMIIFKSRRDANVIYPELGNGSDMTALWGADWLGSICRPKSEGGLGLRDLAVE
ncbi:glutamate receptor 1.3-like [Hibiscus syriacus]|uniref:glutamate receptor 1.3-like n=1 Tax=Hibiscus syriacus TaxID=106335 RepID=UPI001920B125|nr:glutamate receptor 1.3-like [Hibiscus syriacus]